MRILQIVILTLIVAHPDQVLSARKRGKDKKADAKGGPCGKPYLRQLNGRCYYFSAKKMNWFGAQNNCLRKGLNLANLGSPEDYKSVLRFLNMRGNMEDYWFGGNDLQAEGRFTYISNGRMVRYMGELGLVEPTHRSNLDDCLEVRLRANSTMVTDDNCLEKQYFVCEKFEQKCATPTSDAVDNTQHSHEHLHHFHHDPAKGEKREEGGSVQEGMESDSRPVDNTNSAEVGETSLEAPQALEEPAAQEPGKEPGTGTEPEAESGAEPEAEPE
ncbi:uncharacterized protein LOC117592702, partial [Drosophila guanche]